MTINSMTKAQLLAHIASLDATILTQAHELDAMRLRISIAERNAPKPKVQYAPTPRSLPQHFAAARAMAIASGRCVKVTA